MPQVTQSATALPPVLQPLAPFEQRVTDFINDAVAKSADGISLAEAAQIVQALVILVVELARELAVAGPEKKQFAMNAVAALYDRLVGFVVLPWWLEILWFAVGSSVRAMFLDWADGAIEAAYSFIKARLPA